MHQQEEFMLSQMSLAARQGNLQALQFLLGQPGSTKPDEYVMRAAVEGGNIDVAKCALEAGGVLRPDDLYVAMYLGMREMTVFLIEKRCPVDLRLMRQLPRRPVDDEFEIFSLDTVPGLTELRIRQRIEAEALDRSEAFDGEWCFDFLDGVLLREVGADDISKLVDWIHKKVKAERFEDYDASYNTVAFALDNVLCSSRYAERLSVSNVKDIIRYVQTRPVYNGKKPRYDHRNIAWLLEHGRAASWY